MATASDDDPMNGRLTLEAEGLGNYAERLNRTLQPRPDGKYKVLDLFAGCGGLGLGFEAQGFDTTGSEVGADPAQPTGQTSTENATRSSWSPERTSRTPT